MKEIWTNEVKQKTRRKREKKCTGALGKCASTKVALAHLPSAPRPRLELTQLSGSG